MRMLDIPENITGILSFDFDGTLYLPNNEVTVDPKFYGIIENLHNNGWLWVINTGRSLLNMMEGFERSNCPFAPDYLITREREIYAASDSFGRWKRLEDWHEKYVRDTNLFMLQSAEFLARMKRYIEDNTAAQWIEEEGDPAGIIASSEAEMMRIIHYVEKHRKGYDLLGVLRNSIYMRFTHKDYHKGSSLKELSRRAGLNVDKVFAIGDGHNDLDKLHPSVAGMIACVGNSHDDVKRYVSGHGGFVATAHGSHGSIEALNYFFKS